MCALHYWPSGSDFPSYRQHLALYFNHPTIRPEAPPTSPSPPPAIPSSIPTDLIDKEYSHLSPFLPSPICPSIRPLLPCSHDAAQLLRSAAPPLPPFTPLFFFVKAPRSVKNAQQRRAWSSSFVIPLTWLHVAPLLDTEKSFYLLLPHVWSQLPAGGAAQERSPASSILQTLHCVSTSGSCGQVGFFFLDFPKWLFEENQNHILHLSCLKFQSHPVPITV